MITWEERKLMHIKFRKENLREAEHLEDLGVDGILILKCI
jgi:hypothetical protein